MPGRIGPGEADEQYPARLKAGRSGLLAAEREHGFQVLMGTRNDMDGHEVAAYALHGGGAGVGSGFAGGHIAADQRGHIAAADLFVGDELHAGSLDHSISSFDETNQTTGFDHAKSVHFELL